MESFNELVVDLGMAAGVEAESPSAMVELGMTNGEVSQRVAETPSSQMGRKVTSVAFSDDRQMEAGRVGNQQWVLLVEENRELKGRMEQLQKQSVVRQRSRGRSSYRGKPWAGRSQSRLGVEQKVGRGSTLLVDTRALTKVRVVLVFRVSKHLRP